MEYIKKLAVMVDLFLEKTAKKGKSKSELKDGDFLFVEGKHPKVKEGRHFPIDTEARARNALSQVNKLTVKPDWWKSTLKELVAAVAKGVKRRYKNIEISDASKKPGKG